MKQQHIIWIVGILAAVMVIGIVGYRIGIQAQMSTDAKKLSDMNQQGNGKSQPVEDKTVPVPLVQKPKMEIVWNDQKTNYLIKKDGMVVGSIPTPVGEGTEDTFQLIRQTDRYAYIAVRPGGLGGYILFDLGFGLYRFNLQTNALESISNLALAGNASYWVGDISPDESKGTVIAGRKQFAQENQNDTNTTIFVRNVDTKTEQIFTVDSKYGQVGAFHFSPDGKQLAYAAAVVDIKDEAGAVFVIDLTTRKQTEIAHTTKPNIYFMVNGWKDNNTVDYVVRP